MGSGIRTRMLCTRCEEVARPDTRVAGSDLLEVALWCLYLVPGFVYCAWRNVQQRRVCPACGSSALIRESRASRRRIQADPGAGAPAELEPGGRLVYVGRRLGWLSAPRLRFRRVTRGGALVSASFVVFAFVGINTLSTRPNSTSQFQASVEEKDPAEVEKERNKQVERFRHRECDRLCGEFHNGLAKGHRDCLENCMTKLFDSPGEEPDKKKGCGELLDPSACEFVSGSAAPELVKPVGAGVLPTTR
jgi:hypothetical protein